MTIKRLSLALCAFVFGWSVPSFDQAVNPLSAQERAQGWQLLFDGKTLAGWHVSVPPPSAGRSGAAQPPQPGQVGTPTPCVPAQSFAPTVAGGSANAKVQSPTR